MAMFSCKTVEFDKATGRVKRVLSIVDAINEGFSVETQTQKPYRSTLKNLNEIIAYTVHPDIRTAIRFHKIIAADLHARSKRVREK